MSPAAKKPDETTYSGRFAARLRMLRVKSGMTGQEFAIALAENGYKTTATTYYRWESGESEPPFRSLPFLAATLKLSSPRLLLPKN